jgi:CheY-like chemotaxis protein
VRSRLSTLSAVSPVSPMLKQVLYVEDQPLNVMLMRALLESRPAVQLSDAGSGEEGYRLALQSPPDLLLLDLRLPDGHGVDWLRCMREHPELAQVPAVAVTAEPLSDFDPSGFVEVWSKPLDLMHTLRRIDALLGLPGEPQMSGAGQWLREGGHASASSWR